VTLRQKQSAFMILVAKLILEAEALGYETTGGEPWGSDGNHYAVAYQGRK
jgi:hypothetical protein